MALRSCKVKNKDKVGAGPQKTAANLSLIERYAGQSNTKWCLSSAVSEAQTRQKRCSLSTFCPTGLNSPESTWISWQSESADKPMGFQVFECWKLSDKGPTHHLEIVINIATPAYAVVSLIKSLSVKGFGIVNDCTDTYLFLNVQSCRQSLQFEPSLDTMAPKLVCLVMQTLHKSTLMQIVQSINQSFQRVVGSIWPLVWSDYS